MMTKRGTTYWSGFLLSLLTLGTLGCDRQPSAGESRANTAVEVSATSAEVPSTTSVASTEAPRARVGPTIGSRATNPSPASVPSSTSDVDAESVPTTPAQAEAQLAKLCKKAKQSGLPILMEFSADWCKDCKVVHGFKQKPPLAAELTHWRQLTVDVDAEAYESIVQALEVRAIARWILFDSATCAGPVRSWKVLSDRVLEPTRDMAITGPGLTAWLSLTRSKLSAP